MAAPSIPHLEQLLGRALGRPARIASFERLSPWAVARVTLTGGSPATVMVKWVRDYDQRTDPRQIATEQAALIFLAELGFEAAPRLIAADADTLVMEDLAPRRPLAELLVERGMAACKPALMGWAQTLGQLGARTAAHAGRYGAIRAALGPDDPATAERGLGPGWTAVAQALDSLGARPSNAAGQEFAAIEAALRAPGPFAALTNGDVQANNLLVGEDLGNVRLIDYESRCVRRGVRAAPPPGGCGPERHQHRRALAVVGVGRLAQAGDEEALLQPRLQPEAERDEGDPDKGDRRAELDGEREEGRDQTGVDRVAHQPVGAALDQLVTFLAGHVSGPQVAERKPGPPHEGDAAGHHGGHQPAGPAGQPPDGPCEGQEGGVGS
jgi:hypothetical protein